MCDDVDILYRLFWGDGNETNAQMEVCFCNITSYLSAGPRNVLCCSVSTACPLAEWICVCVYVLQTFHMQKNMCSRNDHKHYSPASQHYGPANVSVMCI